MPIRTAQQGEQEEEEHTERSAGLACLYVAPFYVSRNKLSYYGSHIKCSQSTDNFVWVLCGVRTQVGQSPPRQESLQESPSIERE